MGSEKKLFIKRGKAVKQTTAAKLIQAITKGKILRSDLLSYDKVKWVSIIESPEWAKCFATEVSMDTPLDSFAYKEFPDKKFFGRLTCPLCNKDYPELADFQIFSDLTSSQGRFNGWKRFRKFSCDSCGAMLRKDLGPFFNSFQVLILFGFFSGLVTLTTYLMRHDPIGFGFDQFYDYQYVNYPTIMFCLIFTAPLFIALAIFQEEHFQNLRLVTVANNVRFFVDKIFATLTFFSLAFLLTLGSFLNIGKDTINFKPELKIETFLTTAHSLSPFWGSPFHAIEGRLHFRKNHLPEALESFNESMESENFPAFPVFSRGLTYYYLGDYQKAEADFLESLNRHSGHWGLHEIYKKIWVYLALEKSGQSGEAFLKSAASHNNGEWPAHLTSMLLGEKKPEQIFKSLKKGEKTKRCQANFYSGQWHLLKGDPAKARAYFLNAALSQAVNCVERYAADYEWKALPLDTIYKTATSQK